MAVAYLSVAQWNDDAGSVSLAYDDQTLAVSAVSYVNSNPQPAAVTVTINGTPHVVTLAASTPVGTVDVSSMGIVLQHHTGLRGVQTLALPAGYSISSRYPA